MGLIDMEDVYRVTAVGTKVRDHLENIGNALAWARRKGSNRTH